MGNNVDPQGIFGNAWRHFSCYNLGWQVPLVPSRWKPGMLLNISQYIGWPPSTKIFPDQNVKYAKGEKLSSIRMCNKTLHHLGLVASLTY